MQFVDQKEIQIINSNLQKKIERLNKQFIPDYPGPLFKMHSQYEIIKIYNSCRCQLPISYGFMIKYNSKQLGKTKSILYSSQKASELRNSHLCTIMDNRRVAKIKTYTPLIRDVYQLNDGTCFIDFFSTPYLIRFDDKFESKFFDMNDNWTLVDMGEAERIQEQAWDYVYKHDWNPKESKFLLEGADKIITKYFLDKKKTGGD